MPTNTTTITEAPAGLRQFSVLTEDGRTHILFVKPGSNFEVVRSSMLGNQRVVALKRLR